jgi:uncharacterized protein
VVDKIQMDILGLSTSPSSGGAYALILNEANGSRRLPIIIGTYEAQAIALELEHIKPPRPMTHDLMKLIVDAFDSVIKYVWINELREGTFFSKIVMNGSHGEVAVDARPSDAIALAIRFEAQIFVSPAVLDEAGIISDESNELESEKIGVSPNQKSKAKKIDNEPDNMETRLELLHNNLAAAIQAEDYELAARLRDEIQRLKG